MSATDDTDMVSRCEMVLLVQAEFDGELDAGQAAHLASHRAQCSICQEASEQLTQSRALLRDAFHEPAPDRLRQQIMERLAIAEPRPAPYAVPLPRAPRRRWWQPGLGFGLGGFGLGAACAAMLAFLLLTPAEPGLTDQIIAGHVRALQPGHLEDVVSTDRHTVKPWFAGRIDFAPPVRDFAAQGFPLEGGRLDYIGGRPVAALVYSRDKHVINLFVWPAGGDTSLTPDTTERNGYNVVHWTQDGITFWAVSDVEMNQLRQFAQNWRSS